MKEPKIIHGKRFVDSRGFFTETWNKQTYADEGIQTEFVQDNMSFSATKNTFRGLHCQTGDYAQAKLVRCTQGSLVDFAIDVRMNSPNFLKVYEVQLDKDDDKAFFIPRGFLHGFITLQDATEINYKCDNFYSPLHDISVNFKDEQIALNISNRFGEKIYASEKDSNAPNLREVITELSF